MPGLANHSALGGIGSRCSSLALAALSLLCWFQSAPGVQRAPLGPNNPYLVDAWQTDDGLPQSTVTAVTQTRDGYLWLGTQKGLVRFDGVRFKVFDEGNTSVIRNSRIVQLFEDRRNVLWIGTEGGLLEYNAGHFKAHLPPNLGTAHSYARSLCDDETGALWLVSCEWQLLRLQDDKFTVASSGWQLADAQARYAVGNPQGGIWVGTRQEVGAGARGEFAPLYAPPQPTGTVAQALCPSRLGGFWVVDGDGRIQRIEGGRVRSEFHPGQPIANFIFQVYEDRAGNLWMCTGGDGLFRFSPNGAKLRLTRKNGLPTDFIRCLTEDSEGNLWVGTEGGGLCRLRPALFSVYAQKDGLQSDQIVSVHTSTNGGVWAGLNGDHLNRISAQGIEHFGNEDSLWEGHVWSVLEDSAGIVWAGIWGGFFRRDRTNFTRWSDGERIGWQVLALYEDPRGGIWLGQQGLGVVTHLRGNETNALKLPGAAPALDVRCITRDAQGAMWFGTAGDGLYRLTDRECQRLGRTNGLPSETIWSLLAEADGTVWIGSYRGGLSRWREGRIHSFTPPRGLPSDTVCQIFADDAEHLWLGTHDGLFRVAKQELDRVANGGAGPLSGLRFDKSDGLPTLECSGGFQPSSARTADGKWWVPTSKGLVAFDPSAVTSNPRPPPMVIQEVLVDGRVLTNQTPMRVEIPPGRHRLEFQFAALSFTAPEKVRCRHLLEGYDEDWSTADGQRTAEYNYLPPGNYRFRVQACNNDGRWNEIGATLAVVLQPHLWQTLWFRFLAGGLAFASAVGLAWKLSSQRLGKQLAAAERERKLAEERQHAAEELRASNQRYLQFVESAFDGVAIAQDGVTRQANGRLLELLGCTAAEIEGQPVNKFVHPEDAATVADRHAARLQGQPDVPRAYPLRLVRKDGAILWVEFKARRIDWEGRPAILTLIHDISDRRRAEEERGRLERQLRQAQKLEAIGTLAGGIAHDFNNILTGILGYLSLVRDTLGDRADVKEDLREIEAAANRAKDLVRQILTFCRRETSALEPIAAGPIVAEAVRLLRATLPRSIQIEANVDEPLPLVLASATQFHQVIMNLCTNANHALPENRGLIQVNLTRRDLTDPVAAGLAELPPGPVVILEVIDNGCGMDAATVERIFDPFFTTKARERGTGLGLSMVLGIVQSHQGAVRVRSKPGQGTTFTITLPAVAATGTILPVAVTAARSGIGEKIMIVEDEPALGLMMARALTRRGYQPVVFASSQQALEEFRRHARTYRVVVTDFSMPELNGAELISAIRAASPGIPIILASGAADQINDQRARQLGVQVYLCKPFSPEELTTALGHVIESPK